MTISYENVAQIPCKIFGIKCSFTDHLRYKTANKTTCRTPSVNPC